MFSALKKLARSGDERCPAPMPMSSSLQKKFSKGVHFNMKILIKGDRNVGKSCLLQRLQVKILIKGDRNVGKSCLLQRLQGGPFIEDYVPTDQIQVAPIHWTYKNTDFIVKVEVWEVVDKGRTKKKPPLGLKLDNQAAATPEAEGYETPVLDATFLDVYKNASGVILMLDITKPWTFEYVVKELAQVPADLPVVILGNHCDMQHHRQVHAHHIETALQQAKINRTAPVRYAESSMRNGFGLRLLHKFLSVPFLRLQRTSLLEQLQRNQKDVEEIETDLDEFQKSEESHYDIFVDRLANKRRQSTAQEPKLTERSPSIVLGAGKPIIPPNASVNPLLAQSIPAPKVETPQVKQQTQYVSQELINPKHKVSMNMTPPRLPQHESVAPSGNISSSGALDEFYAGTLDSSFLDDLTPMPSQETAYESDSDEDTNPRVIVDQDELDIDVESTAATWEVHRAVEHIPRTDDIEHLMNRSSLNNYGGVPTGPLFGRRSLELSMDSDFPIWAGDSSARRSPEGGEDPDIPKEPEKTEKKKSKKKSKNKERGDYSDKSERKEKKNKHKKSKEKNPQQDLLSPSTADFNYEEYDSL